jgi:hypothetical protein
MLRKIKALVMTSLSRNFLSVALRENMKHSDEALRGRRGSSLKT